MCEFPLIIAGDVRVFRYSISHSELWLRNTDFGRVEPRIEICFTGVERMELDQRYTGGLTLTPLERHGDLDDGAPLPLLLLELAGGSFGSGFVACSKVAVRRFHWEGEDLVFDRVVCWEGAAYSAHSVGGRPAEPGEAAFGRPVLRRFAREKVTAPRFRRPPDPEDVQPNE